MTTITKYIPVITLIILLIQYLSLLWRGRSLEQKIGMELLSLHKKPNKFFYVAASLLPIIVLIQFFRELSPMLSLVISGSAVLALEVLIREKILTKHSGVYEHALIVDGRLLWKADIIALPTLSYEKDTDEQNNADIYAEDAKEIKEKSLKIVTKNSGIIYVGFSSKEEREKAVSFIHSWVI